MIDRCNFLRTETGWACTVCGRAIRVHTDIAPHARCGGTPMPGVAPAPPPVPARGGAGTELTKLLAAIGIEKTPGCKCRDRSALMDSNGIEWCANNITTISNWMGEEAAKRKMPFIATLARLMVRRAIHNARKEASRHATQETDAGKAV